MLLKLALVRPPGRKYGQCISAHPLQQTINLSHAYRQHKNYCKVLEELGIELIILPPDDKHPDSCFVEDTAVIRKGKALISRMAKESRQGEEETVLKVLKEHLEVKKATEPATIEGGDVIHLPDRFISGITQRTNFEGVKQLEDWLDLPVNTIVDLNIVHLKSYITYLGKNTIIATEMYTNHPFLKDFNILTVPKDETYAANTLTIGETVLMPQNFPKTKKMIAESGFEVITLQMTEFEKCEGALTCLSLLF
ncbi:MAG: dimethylarginine dimethylaminohydrolase family protein [Candidatus Hermodarchaeota archaeon]